tara:strand:+ start:124 stop:612 length:489 start_codon:yes stop_codon:yes gene_type:complete
MTDIELHIECHERFAYNEENGKLYYKKNNKEFGSKSSNGYLRGKVNSKSYAIHRLIWLMKFGDFPLLQLDHVNRNRLDNRMSNLREASNAQNNINKPPKGKFKGVSFEKSRGKFRAYTTKGGKTVHIGRFDCELEAAKAYDKRVREIFGEFAYLNFPELLEN